MPDPRLRFTAKTAALLACALLAQAQPTRTFERVVLLEEKGETSAGVSIGDLNGDGLLDIVLGKGRHWPLFNRILLNDGHGGFTASNLGAAPDRTYSAALADIDRDGDLDIVVSNDAPDRKLVYINDGKGHFTESGTFGDPQWTTRYVTLADLNGDGYPDIVAANRGGLPQHPTPSYVCFNDGKGHFPDCRPLPTESATSIVAADFDGDGALDLFVPHRDGGQSIVLWNDGKGHFPTSTKVGPANANIRMGAAGDLDGDGQPDLAIIEERLKAAFVILNRGKRQFGEPARLPGPERPPYCLAIADLNRDQHPDVIVGYVELPGSIYFNTGNGRTFDEVRWNDGKGTVYGLAFADLDGDGWPDIVAARSDAPNGIWFSTKPGVTAPAETLLDHLPGKWVLEGMLAGKQATHDVVATSVLNGQYVQLHEIARERDSKGLPVYEAFVYLTWESARGEYSCQWLDSTGNSGLSNGVTCRAKPAGDDLRLLFKYPNGATFHTTFAYDRRSDIWKWSLDGEENGRLVPFARMTMRRR